MCKSSKFAYVKKVASVFLFLMLVVPMLTSCEDIAQSKEATLDPNKITIGVKIDQPGLGFKNGDEFTGLDVDVAKYVAGKFGYTPDQIIFKEAPSKQRETLLEQGDVDMIFATYTISEKRREMVSFAGPYFVAGQDLLVRRDQNDIKGPSDLEGRNLCSVTGSTSAQTIKDKFAKTVNLMEQPGYTECVTALLGGAVDAVTTDDIILAGLASATGGGKVKVVGNPFTKEQYGVGIKLGDVALAKRINVALQEMINDGSWDQAIKDATAGTDYSYNKDLNPPEFEDISIIEKQESIAGANQVDGLEGVGYLFEKYDIFGAFLVNIELTLWAALFSLILGIILLVFRISPIPSLRIFSSGFVSFFRNIPLTIVMVFMVLGAWTQLNLQFSTDFDLNFFWLAVVGLSLYHSAFVCEALRSGVNTVPIGQAEAARSLGLNFANSAKKIILPQAFRGAIAPLGNTLIALLKNTTVAAAASVATETSSLMSNMIEFDPQLIFIIFLIIAVGYVVLVIPIGLLTTYFSDRLAVKR